MLERFTLARRSPPGPVESPLEPLGVRLKSYFDGLTACNPMPDRLAQLAVALEAALDDGPSQAEDAVQRIVNLRSVSR